MEKMRLQKYLAHCGVASRRKAEEYILQRRVKVNGVVIDELGTLVEGADKVQVDGKAVRLEKRSVYVMLNKPKGYVTTSQDEHDRRVVTELVKDIPERVYPVGRLDYSTSGLLLLTNDGDFANKMTHPRNHVLKTYIAKIDKNFSGNIVSVFEKGIVIDRRKTAPAHVRKIMNLKGDTEGCICQIQISEGRNRQIRKLFEAADCNVLELERVAIGELELAELKVGKWRYLTADEVKKLLNKAL